MNSKNTREVANTIIASLSDSRAYEDFALRELRNAGYRITMPRVQVIRALADSNKALSAYAIHEKILHGGGKIDVVSVYRILTTLQEVGLIHHVGVVDGYFPCRTGEGQNKRSEVVIDEDSGEVLELSLPRGIIEQLETQVKDQGFEVTGIKVEITARR